MAFQTPHGAAQLVDRRVATRYLVDCPARFAFAGGVREGRISDLSEHGARFDTAQPPQMGTGGFLKWNNEDLYCTVIWSNAVRCGIRFERPISQAVVEATCSQIEYIVKPVAALVRIPLGQKRSGRLALCSNARL